MRSVLTQASDGARTFGAHVAALASALSAAQAGAAAALPDAAGSPRAVEVLEGALPGEFTLTFPGDAPAGVAAVVRTSGSTGMPKRTALPAAALAASAAATREHLGGDGHWLLALPLHYVAGLAVVSRALLGNTRLATLDLRERFTPAAFAEATSLLAAAAQEETELGEPLRPLYTSLVPTQLTRLLEDPAGTVALRSYAAVLVGGGRTPDATRARAREAGIAVVLTYGSAETCGGCVYDGVPLPGVRAEAVGGRLRLGGPMVAGPYLGDAERTAEHFSEDAGTRWYLTDDLGAVTDGVLSVSGRVDDVINTGGVKVSAQEVLRVVEAFPGVRGALVLGVPDPEWGQRVALVLEDPASREPSPVPDDAASALEVVFPPSDEAIADAVRIALGSPAVPRLIWRPAVLPRLGNGKPDRRTCLARLQELA